MPKYRVNITMINPQDEPYMVWAENEDDAKTEALDEAQYDYPEAEHIKVEYVETLSEE